MYLNVKIEMYRKMMRDVLKEAGCCDVDDVFIEHCIDNGTLSTFKGIDGRDYMLYMDYEDGNRFACYDIEQHQYITSGRLNDIFPFPSGMPEDEEVAKRLLFKTGGMTDAWLEVHFNEECENNSIYFEKKCDVNMREYIWFSKTDKAVWLDSGEFLTSEEIENMNGVIHESK